MPAYTVTVEFTVSAPEEALAVDKVRTALNEVNRLLNQKETSDDLVHLTDFWIVSVS